MPRINVRKRAAPTQQDADSDASPEPATQRRRVSEGSDDDEGYGNESGISNDNPELQEMAKKLIRLALACEYTRRPLRRPEIGEKVLGSAGRQFKSVFNEAQRQLRHVFGMEMVELPAKEKVTVQQRRAAQKSNVQNKPITTWIVRSALPPEFRQEDVDIITPPAYPTTEEEAKYVGIYTLLVSLMILHGGSMTDAKVKRFLRRVGLEDNTPIADCKETEKLTKRLEKDGYLLKIKENSGAGEDEIYWFVGPRGRMEVGDHGARGLTMAVYGHGDMAQAAQAELERKISKSLALNDRPEPKTQEAAPPKKRGRKKKNPRDDEDEDEDRTRQGSDDDDDDDDD